MQPTKSIEQLDREAQAQVVATILGRGVTRAELSAAFDRVQPKDHWKNPIDAVVVFTEEGEREVMAKAIQFFTGSTAKFEVVRLEAYSSTYRVTAAGYFATIGA